MARKDKLTDKNYILNCDMPSELFTVRGIKKEFRALAKLWHPDVNTMQEAKYIMSKINALYNEGLSLIAQHKFYERERLLSPNRNSTVYQATKQSVNADELHNADEVEKRSKKKRSIELKSASGKCVRFKYLKRVMIELGYMYVSEEHILLEITKLKRKIFLDAIDMIKNNGDVFFKMHLPHIIDTFETTTHGYVVIKKEKGIEPIITLEMVMGYLKPLGSRKICEGIFYDLMALKYMGLTSTGIDKDLWFIDVNTGKLHNYGLFFYLHEFNSRLTRAPKEVTTYLSEIKAQTTETTIINLVKKIIVTLNMKNGLKIDDFHKWITALNSDSLEVSLAESQVFNRSIASVTTHGFNLEAYYAAISNA